MRPKCRLRQTFVHFPPPRRRRRPPPSSRCFSRIVSRFRSLSLFVFFARKNRRRQNSDENPFFVSNSTKKIRVKNRSSSSTTALDRATSERRAKDDDSDDDKDDDEMQRGEEEGEEEESQLERLSKTRNDLFRRDVVNKLDGNSAKVFSQCARWCHADVVATKLIVSREFKIRDRQSLTLARKLGMPLTVATFNRAIEQGDATGNDDVIEMLLKEFNCEADSTSVSCAARFGRRKVVELLVNEGVKCNHNAITRAAYAAHWDVVIWLRENGCSWKKSLVRALAEVKNGKHMVRYIERQSCLPTDVYSDDEETV